MVMFCDNLSDQETSVVYLTVLPQNGYPARRAFRLRPLKLLFVKTDFKANSGTIPQYKTTTLAFAVTLA